MQTESETKIAGSGKLWIMLFILAALIYLVDFFFYGQRIYNIAGAFGFGLMAFGAWKNEKIASNSGAVIVIAAIASKYLL